MTQKQLSKWLKAVLIGLLLCLEGVYGYVIPEMGGRLKELYPEFASRYFPWIIFIMLTAIPCLMILLLGWKIADSIGNCHVFSTLNEHRCKKIAVLCIADCAFFFLGNLVYLFLNLSHPAVLIASLFVLFLGISLAVVFSILGNLIGTAAQIEEENRMTI